MIEEHAVSAANGHLPIAKWIPRKAHAGRGIEQMSLRTAPGNTGSSALHHAVERGSTRCLNESTFLPRDTPIHVNFRCGARVIRSGIPVVNQVVRLVIRSEQADAQPEIQGQIS